MLRLRRYLPALLVAAAPGGLGAQDVEMLGRRYGTRPPAAYYEAVERDPGAFRFTRGRAARVTAGGAAPRGGPALALGPREGPLAGVYHLPALLGLFADSPPSAPFTQGEVQSAYFGSQPGTVSDYYAEVSGGRFDLVGETRGWVRSTLSQDSVTNGNSGLGSSRIGAFIHELLALQTGVDWGRYDNDGPDGVPNSPDDDGFVDALAVIHPTEGAECGGPGQLDRIWAHKWSLLAASGSVFVTDVASNGAAGGNVKVDDYFVQGVLSCSSGPGSDVMNEIGVFTHETGHAFGLPDLYDTCPQQGPALCGDDTAVHAGAGVWDLMAAGTWGCDDRSPESPCHLGAWSKAQLGWVEVTTLSADTDHGILTLPPVEATGEVYRVDAGDGSGEYFLLENRQPLGYDANLLAGGLLVWQVHADSVLARWPSNTVNGFAHRGVWLRQADGADDLGRPRGGRGDAGDPFPGASDNHAFHAGSQPASVSFAGAATGLTLLDVQPAGTDVRLRLSTRFSAVTLRAEGVPGQDGIFTVDGTPVDPPLTSFSSAPYAPLTIGAATYAHPAPGERQPFEGWRDDGAAAAERGFAATLADTTLTASYGSVEFLLSLSTSGGVGAVEPATFLIDPSAPDGWYTPGTDVTIEAVALTGFAFLGWSGDLVGRPNPTTAVMTGPVSATADLELIFEVAGVEVDVTATVEQAIQLQADNGAAPYSWRVVGGGLPIGLALSGTGRISGAALETGTFGVEVEATDSNGLPASGTVTLRVGEPDLSIQVLTAPFLLTEPRPSPAELNFLNLQGNRVSGYDIGDFRAWVLAHPSLPLAAAYRSEARSVTVTVPLRREDPGDAP